MQAPPPLQATVNAGTVRLVGPVKVDADGVVQLTLNFHSRRLFEPKFIRYSGEPSGGAVVPSRSAGRSPPYAVESWKHCCWAVVPLIIAVRSQTQTLEPANVWP